MMFYNAPPPPPPNNFVYIVYALEPITELCGTP